MAKQQALQKPPSEHHVLDSILKLFQIGSALIKISLLVLFGIFFIVLIAATMPHELEKGNVALIPLTGLISTGQGGLLEGAGTDSQNVIDNLEDADKNDDIKAIILEIDSPGGTPVASAEIANAIKATNKTVISVIRAEGASGAYWVASATDRIFANPMSITGSIGVTASGLEFGKLLQQYNVTYRRLIAGKYKDAGTQLRDMTPEEQQLFQKLLDELHTQFIKTVAENRHLDENYVRNLSTGWVYLGTDAKELGLVDELGGRKEALKYLEQTLNITATPVEYGGPQSLLDKLAGLTSQASYHLGQGIGSSLSSDTKVSLT